MLDQPAVKKLTASSAVDALVQSGMKLGLGTGSTAIHAVRRVGELLASGALKELRVVPTSLQTLIECQRLRIPCFSLNSPEIDGALDLCIDGADEVDRQNRCIKGGGGALLLEKITAYAAETFCVIVDESKQVEHLGLAFPLPIEVVPEARLTVERRLAPLGSAVLREALRKAGPVITEHANVLLDLRFRAPVDPALLEADLNRIPGIVENGFFVGRGPGLECRPRIIVYSGRADGSVTVR
jgi:ribose 5-phosphate isomerase A